MLVSAKQCRLCRRGVRWWWASVAARWHSTSGQSPLRRLLDEASTFGEAEAVPPDLQWATQPYAAAPPPPASTERTDPHHTTVLLFPGEDSYHVGMGLRLRDLPAARELYELASGIVGWDVWRACTAGAGPEEARREVGVLVTSLAALERVRAERPSALERARAAAGWAVGELAALTFAGALTLEAALRLAELRAAAARAGGAERAGAALRVHLAPGATLGAALARARDHAAERGVPEPECRVAAYLYPGCKLVAGDLEAVQWLERHGAEHGVRRAERAAGAGALAGRAAGAVREGARALAGTVREPRVRVLCGAEGRAYRGARDVARGLAGAGPLRWEQTLHHMYARPRAARFPLTLVLGPGTDLRHTLRQVNARAWDRSLQVRV